MLGLTLEEKKVILFLAAAALLGTGVNFLVKMYLPVKTFAALTQDMGKVDLNKADKELLKSIPGVGDKLAERILEYRHKKGDFSGIEELRDIKGVTGSRFEKIKDSFMVDKE